MKSERELRSILAKIRKIEAEYDKYYQNSLTAWEKEGVEHCRRVDVKELIDPLSEEELEVLNEIILNSYKVHFKKDDLDSKFTGNES